MADSDPQIGASRWVFLSLRTSSRGVELANPSHHAAPLRSQVAEVGEQRCDVWLDDGPPPCAEREEVIVVCFNEIDPV